MPALFGAMAKRYGWPSVKAITCEVVAFCPTSADSDHMNSRPSAPNLGEPPLGPVVDEQTPVRVAEQRLRNTLRINALTSTLGGLVCVLAGGWTSTTLGTRHAGLVRLVGLGLVVFAVGVAAVAGSRVSKLSRWAPVVSTADAVWVVATVATVGAGWYSAIGVAVVGGVALMVGGFGLAQFRASRHLCSVVATRPMSMFDEVPPVEVAHVERTVRSGREVAWAVVTDHELYGRLAPNLSAVHVQSGTGAGMVRVCSNKSGEEWSETCAVWDEGERFEVNVRYSGSVRASSVCTRMIWRVAVDFDRFSDELPRRCGGMLLRVEKWNVDPESRVVGEFFELVPVVGGDGSVPTAQVAKFDVVG